MIHTIHWDVVETDEFGSVVLIIWPAPIDADSCFSNAGFTDFQDSSPEWDRDFREITIKLAEKLREFGEVTILEEISHYKGPGAILSYEEDKRTRQTTFVHRYLNWPTPKINLIDQIIISTEDFHHYDIEPCSFDVLFGDVRLRTGCEHSLFKIYLPDRNQAEEIVDFVAEERAKKETHLDWSLIEKL